MIRKAALQIGVPALLALIPWNAYLAVSHLKRVEKSAALTLESSALQAELSGLLRDVTDMESGQRGYLLTGDAAYLEPYTDAKSRIEMDFANLHTGLSNRTQHEQLLELQLEALAKSKQAEMERSISLRQHGYRLRSFKLIDTDEGKGYMDEIRRIASSLSSSESSNFARLKGEDCRTEEGIFCNHYFQFCPAGASNMRIWADPPSWATAPRRSRPEQE